MLSLLIGLFIHEDLMAVVCFVIVVISFRINRIRVTRGGLIVKFLIAFFSLLTLLQYAFTLDLPPSEGIALQYPWYKLDPEVKKWYLVKTNTIANLMSTHFIPL
jgi:hypothetical protein